jgi:hypothetical protein
MSQGIKNYQAVKGTMERQKTSPFFDSADPAYFGLFAINFIPPL